MPTAKRMIAPPGISPGPGSSPSITIAIRIAASGENDVANDTSPERAYLSPNAQANCPPMITTTA